MDINQETINDILIKAVIGAARTNNYKNWFEEEFPWTIQLDWGDIYAELVLYAVDEAQADANVIASPTVLSKIVDYPMIETSGANGQSYIVYDVQAPGVRLTDFISPVKYGPGYHISLKDADGQIIALTDGSYYFDHNNGILQFDNEHTPITMGWQLPIYITGYLFIGYTVKDVITSGSSVHVYDPFYKCLVVPAV